MTSYTTLDSPVGELFLVGEEAPGGVALTSVSMPRQRNAPKTHISGVMKGTSPDHPW